MTIKTPIKHVRGLGAAKDGVSHFWHQRATAVALVPLVIWFLSSMVAIAGADYDRAKAYVAQPVTAILLILLLGTAFFHMRLGLQVIVEDYIHREGSKIALLLVITFGAVALALTAIYSVLRISFGA